MWAIGSFEAEISLHYRLHTQYNVRWLWELRKNMWKYERIMWKIWRKWEGIWRNLQKIGRNMWEIWKSMWKVRSTPYNIDSETWKNSEIFRSIIGCRTLKYFKFPPYIDSGSLYHSLWDMENFRDLPLYNRLWDLKIFRAFSLYRLWPAIL